MPLRDTSVRAVLRVVLVVLAVAGALMLLWMLRKPLSWLVLALFVAVAISGPVNLLHRRMRRGAAIALSYIGLLLIPLTLLAIVTPSVVNGLEDLAREVPTYAKDLRKQVQNNPRLHKLDTQYGVSDRLVKEAGRLPTRIGDAASILTSLGVQLVNSIFAGVTILILSVFMVSRGRGWIDDFLARQHEAHATRLRRALDRSADAIGNYVGGVLLQASIAGVVTFVVLTILGVPFAAPLAVLTALLDAIPLIGATIGAVVVAVVTLFVHFPTVTLIWIVFAVVYQQVENTIIQPRIQSRAVDVQPFVIIVSVLFGSTLFGIGGALLAVPVAASFQILGREYLEYRRELADQAIIDPAEPSAVLAPSAPSVITPRRGPG